MKARIFTLFLNFSVSWALFKHRGLLPASFQFLFYWSVQTLMLGAPTVPLTGSIDRHSATLYTLQ